MLRSHSVYSFGIAVAAALAACSKTPAPDAYGNMEATEVVVGAETPGRLLSFTPVEGNKLTAGQRVAVVDTIPLVLQLQQAVSQRSGTASRVNEAAQQIDVLQVQREIAARNYERIRRLYDQKAATAQQFDQAERDFKVLTEQLQAARAQEQSVTHDVSSNTARVAQVREQINRSAVTNPVAGTVLATYTKAGEYVQPGQPLYKIANLDTLELRAYVTEPQLAMVKIGQAATVEVDVSGGGGSRRAIQGRVSWISSDAEFTPTPIQTRDERRNLVYAVKIRVPNENGVLKIGMPADVRVASTVAVR